MPVRLPIPNTVIMRSAGRVVYIGSHSHRFYALDLATGAERWVRLLPDRIDSSAAASADGTTIYVGTRTRATAPIVSHV